MLYSKNGSIPKPETDGTSGWVEVPEPPIAPEGKEVVWWCPPGWVVRDPQPGPNFSWSQSEERWVEYEIQQPEITVEPTPSATSDIQLDLGSAAPTTEI